MSFVKIIGTGKYTPDNVMTNEDLSKIVETSDEWIQSRTGIVERRISKGEDTTELAIKAAKNALKRANIVAEDIDLIVLGTTTPDSLTPSLACRVQAGIGAVNAVAFDIAAACSGLLFGLEIGKSLLLTGAYKRALIIGSEVLSKIVDWNDRNTCVLFGDGASALVLEKNEDINGIIHTSIGSDGVKGVHLTCAPGERENIFAKFSENEKSTVVMNGKEVFKFAVNIIEKSIKEILKVNNLSQEDIKYVICHQANARILDFAAKKCNISREKFYMNLNKYGNTSSASIGIALDEMVNEGLLRKGDKVILVGFGGGLTWGSALIEWSME